METKDVILELRNKNNLSQDELAEKVFVTRQAVSRWETPVSQRDTTLKTHAYITSITSNFGDKPYEKVDFMRI